MRPDHGFFAARSLQLRFVRFQRLLPLVVVLAVGVLGCFVGAAGAVGRDDGGEGAGGAGEEDFEGEREVADECEAFRGAVNACCAGREADEAAYCAAFDGFAEKGVSMDMETG